MPCSNPVAVAQVISQVFGDRVQLNSADADFTDLIDLSLRFNRFDLVDGQALGLSHGLGDPGGSLISFCPRTFSLRNQARSDADLAAAQLILGDLDEALESMHVVQQNYHLAGRWQALQQNLTNESRLLTEESRTEAARAITARISTLENAAI